MPRIGCIAWGSLLWDPRTLPLAAPFERIGPELPIEFSRVALDGRVTLVIDPEAPRFRTFVAPLAVDSLSQAIAELARREGVAADRVEQWIGVEGPIRQGETPDAARGAIAEWLTGESLDAVLFTALPARLPDGRFARPDRESLVAHLARLAAPARERAEQYIRRAPRELVTPNRTRFEVAFGWTPQAADAAAGGPVGGPAR